MMKKEEKKVLICYFSNLDVSGVKKKELLFLSFLVKRRVKSPFLVNKFFIKIEQ